MYKLYKMYKFWGILEMGNLGDTQNLKKKKLVNFIYLIEF